MDNNYQQTMIQALMGQQSAAPGMAGQNPTTPYGQGFITGNMMNPTGAANPFQAAANGQQSTGMNSSLTTGPSTQMLQPFSTY